jgi:hypothetical protein
MTLLPRVFRGLSIGCVWLAGSLALAVPGACARNSAPDAVDDLVPKSGALTWAADGHRSDYDGDGISDFTVYRPSTGAWWMLPRYSSSGSAVPWGAATDWPLRGDFDADGEDDLAVWRPSTGEWFVRASSTGYGPLPTVVWGHRGDVPVPGDYNADGLTDFAYWTRATATWNVLLNGGGSLPPVQWGEPGDEPVQADYDGDHKTDYAVWRSRTGEWWWMKSSSAPNGWERKTWGATMDIPVPGADTDGDHKADLMVYRPETTRTYWLASSENYATSHSYDFPGGGPDTDPIFATDIPVAGHYFANETGGSIGFWRPSTGMWTVQDSANPVTQFLQQWGAPSDIPLNGQRFVPFVSSYRTRVANVTEYEAQVVTIPPNVAGCGANGAAFLTGSSNLSRMSLSCWQNGPSNHQTAACTTQCQTNADCPSGQTCLPATGAAKTSMCVYSVINNYTQDPGAEDVFESFDNNMVRMKNGHLLYEKLLARYQPCASPYHSNCAVTSTECGVQNRRHGIAQFYDSNNCGGTWTKVNTAAITETMFGGDWHALNLDGSRALHNNPYSGRVYFSAESSNCQQPGSGKSELFYSTNYAQTWTRYPAGLPASGGSYSSTSSPEHREYFFGCPNGFQPTLYVFSEWTNQVTAVWTDTQNQCGWVAWSDGSPNVSFVSSGSDGDHIRIAYPQVSSGRQTLHLTTLNVLGPDEDITVVKEADNVIQATAPNGSIVQVTQVEPDMLDLPASVPTNVTLLYWVESDGPVVAVDSTQGACREPGSSGGLMCAAPGTKVTNKGMILRDLNIWSPVFPVSETDSSGASIYWPNWHCYGDYRRGGFAYDPASNMLNFYAYYIGSDDHTWHTNVISAHP